MEIWGVEPAGETILLTLLKAREREVVKFDVVDEQQREWILTGLVLVVLLVDTMVRISVYFWLYPKRCRDSFTCNRRKPFIPSP